ncbi:MAG TPA: enoyl-CoA hydratase/isomerase family protein [bacterium]|nr:enoyl-CoA hydratase/isomerase family protein [bacterium]
MKSFRHIELEHRGEVLWIYFNRPQVKNAFNLEKAREFLQAVRFGMKAKSVAVIVLAGKGDTFSAGGDIKLMKETKAPKKFFLEISRLIHRAVVEIRRGPKPVLAAISGYVGGVAFGFVLATDFRVATEDSHFNAATIRLGLVANGGATYHLPRIVGFARASEILFLGEILNAREALKSGLVNRLVPPGRLLEETQTLAERLAAGPRKALARLKKTLNESLDSDLVSQLQRERQAIAWSSTQPDFQEGIRAFLEKRKPVFNRTLSRPSTAKAAT